MLFHILQFLLFFTVVFFLNLLLVNVFRHQNLRKWLLLVASLVFYITWNVPLVSLLIFCILMNYFCGIQVSDRHHHRKLWVWISVVINLGILAVFKYLDFGIQTAAELCRAIGFQVNPGSFDLILPLGISFFTFQSMGYVIDIYRGKYQPYRSFMDFALFVSFFPQLIAGPIVRADFFLKSLEVSKNPILLKNVNNGLFLLTVGIFKKAVLADNSAHIANMVFHNPQGVSSLLTLFGVLAFASQIYFDFSGYTDMARGLGRMLGIELPENFNRPYIAANIRDFWKRWHISLSTWLRDYLYISLGGSRCSSLKTYRNLFLTMLLGGLWHGASMNFVIWGGIHGSLLTLEHYLNKTSWASFINGNGSWKSLLWKIGTFVFVCFAWIFFRAETFGAAMEILRSLGDFSGYANLSELNLFRPQNWLFGLILPFVYIFLAERYSPSDTSSLAPLPRAILFCIFFSLILLVSGATNEFIYFQF